MSFVIYGTRETRITLYNVGDETPVARITLQKETKEGLQLKFAPEGTRQELSLANLGRLVQVRRGFRPSMSIKWDGGVHSLRSAWTGSAWGPATEILTVEALVEILNAGFQRPILVEPHLDHVFAFWAQPDPKKAFELRDFKGAAHTGLTLDLVGSDLVGIPEFVS